MNKEEILKIEQDALEQYLSDLQGFVNLEKSDLDALYEQYLEDWEELRHEVKQDERIELIKIANKAMSRKNYRTRKNYIERLGKVIHSPYFARIDVNFNDGSADKPFYIGKIGFPGYKLQKEITDWRSPVASLYYNHAFAKTGVGFSVEAWNALDNAKIIACDLNIRRTIEIEHSKLLNIYDDSLLENVKNESDFLLSKLKSKKGGGLEDIIETIQQDQNEIIRHSPTQNIIVQGVAGSGKTTVAIHRISYLFYNFADKFLPTETLLLSASKVLMNYLSKSLPELDIYNIKKVSITELLKEVLDQNEIKIKTKVVIYEPEEKLENFFVDIPKFLQLLGQHIKDVEYKLRLKFEIDVIEGNDTDFYKLSSIYSKNQNNPILETIHIIEEDLKETRDELRNDITYKDSAYSIDAHSKSLDKIKEILKSIKDFSKIVKLEAYYFDFLKTNYVKLPDQFELNHLSALYYMSHKLGALKKLDNYNLVVVDEAHDLNLLNFYCVKTFSTKNRFNFYGDLNQSVRKRFSISSWDELNTLFDFENTRIFNLGISYRSSRQIINKANEYLKEVGITDNLPVSVAKNGPEPIIKSFNRVQAAFEDISKEIQKIRKSDFKSIGIIQTEDIDKETLKEAISNGGHHVEVITDYFDNFQKDGIYIAPLRLVKGLEFDTVFVLNFDAPEFNDKFSGHYRKFVSATRAMNQLYIYSLN